MNPPPSRVRYQVLALACMLAALTYLDRARFGVAAPTIVTELQLDSVADLKWAIAAFAIAYGLFEIPTGWWGDRFGPRRVLIRVVLWWSFFTALTGLVGWRVAGITLGGLSFLVAVRFLFGMGEAGAFPNIARALQNWFPPESRARAQGLVWMSARLMGGLTPLIWTVLVAGTDYTSSLLTWRGAFLLFGSLGIAWCVVFALSFRNRPADHPRVNAAELELIQANRDFIVPANERVPWRALFLQPNLVCLSLTYLGITYGWYFNMMYLPACLETQYGVERTSVFGSVLKGGPLWLGAIGCLLGGYWTDRMLRAGYSLRWSRRLPGLFGLSLCAVCYVIATGMPNAWSFALAISLAAFFNDWVMGGAWATCQDVGGRHTAVLAGVLNTAASAGAAISGWLIGVVLEQAPNLSVGYERNLLSFGAVTFAAAICWLGTNAEKRLRE